MEQWLYQLVCDHHWNPYGPMTEWQCRSCGRHTDGNPRNGRTLLGKMLNRIVPH